MQLKRVKTADVYPSEGNPREDFGDLDALAASFELNPAHPGEPLNPPLVVQDGGVYRIVDGERRWRAMRQAGTDEFDAVVCEDWADADAALAMLATDDKKPLDEVERSRGVQRALLLGIEPRKVEKAARRKGLRKVKRAAERLGGEAELMSLDHLMAVDELADGHPELADEVAGADESTWERVYRDAVARVERERDAQALRDEAARLGMELAGAQRGCPDGMCYAETCRTPDALAAAWESHGGGALYSLNDGSTWDGARVVVYEPARDEAEDPALSEARERSDEMAEGIRDMLHSVRAHLVPLAMDRVQAQSMASMADAVAAWLGDADDAWGERAKAADFLEAVEYDGARPDGTAYGMAGAAMLRGWLYRAVPSTTALFEACGGGELSEYTRRQLEALLDCLGSAEADGWKPNPADLELIKEINRAFSEGSGENEKEEQ